MKNSKKKIDIMKWLKGNVATKKDLEKELKPIRKELADNRVRLDGMATKKDLVSIHKELTDYGNRLDGIEKNMATKQDMVRVYESLSDHEMRLVRIEENMVTKQELTRIYETQDKVLEIVMRNDHELTMTKHTVEEHDDAIRQIKPMLGLA